MSDHGVDTSKAAHPLRPRHRMSRSITETNASRVQRHHGHQLLHRRHHQDRHIDHRIPQSAIPTLQMPPRGSLDLPRSEGVTPYLLSSAEQSRRTSMLPPGAEDIGTMGLLETTANKDKQPLAQNEEARPRTTGLRKSLSELTTFSIATTRRLDDAYYAVLEKLSTLHSTVASIKELAVMSRETASNFEIKSKALVAETSSQLDSLGQFNEQQDHIEALQARIQAGRQKVQKLSERVDIVRERVEGWERADREWQERTRRRLKTIWIITSVLALVFVLLVVGAQYAPLEVFTDMMSSNGSGGIPGNELHNTSRVSDHLVEDVRAALNQSRGAVAAVDADVFRALDEL
ncbi:hypothetical protein PFICI_00252 [Pestalotiopsis fici W106-1]|uniref:Uncharacterized protein n=1 Tax=Pestalotiopsis fici (strain W106-1 / CGMCC3.15140) TaxID=1229662 RepID=W3XK80_PESFW|nr:uncharacterized protein PFICI_00252 [Pestalotiopsis fici W106-1]ETS86424.1 hypothetical protein PFICI_00252 [Pestalotiopsis fici W106-1]